MCAWWNPGSTLEENGVPEGLSVDTSSLPTTGNNSGSITSEISEVNSIESNDTGYSTEGAQQLEPLSSSNSENAQQLEPPSVHSVRKAQKLAPQVKKVSLSPNILVNLPSYEVIGFLDSGSTVSAVSRKVADDLTEVRLTKPRIMRSASGVFAVETVVNTTFTIGKNKPFNYTFYVMNDLTKSVLLGYDFLKEFNISIHPGDDTYEIDGRKFDFVKVEGELKPAPSEQIHLMEHIEYMRDNNTIDPEHEEKFFNLAAKYAEIFDDKPSIAKVTPMRIETGDSKPKKQAVRPINNAKVKIALGYTQDQIDMKIMVKSNSPWGSNYVYVSKKETTELRPYGDYRDLNTVTKADAYPMPDVKTILYNIAPAKWFSTFDLSKGFNQIPIHPDDTGKTAVYIPLGLMEYVAMPFGLKNAPAVFQRIMEEVLGENLRKHVLVYIDDVIIYSEDEEQHMQHLEEFFKRMREFNFKINPKKIQPFQQRIKILGHIIQNHKCEPDPEKIEGIRNCPIPKTKKQLRSFLGMVSYYRNFIEHLAQKAKPLYRLSSEIEYPGTVVTMNAAALDAFEQVKEAVIGLVLHMPNLNGQFSVQTDASGYGLGAVLLTLVGDKLTPVCFQSRNLTAPEMNYTVTEQECLAVVWACEKFRPFIECTYFEVITDHKALTWLTNLKDPKGRLARWVFRLTGFNFEIKYRPGSLNYVPDMLSRNPVQKDDSKFLPGLFAVEMEEEIQLSKFPLFENLTRLAIIEAQKSDEFLTHVREYMKDPKAIPTEGGKRDLATIMAASQDAFELEDGLLVRYCNPFKELAFLDDYNYERIMIPESLKEQVMRRMHDDPISGHLGADSTYQKIHVRFYWPKMYTEVGKYCQSCHACQVSRYENQKPMGLMRPRNKALPWETISVDLIGPLPLTFKLKNRYAIVFVDLFSGWPEVFPLTDKQNCAEGCAESALKVFCQWGFPTRILSDSGPQFASKLWCEVMKLLKIRAVFTAPYQPQGNITERKNRDIKVYLTKYMEENHRNWDQYLHLMLSALRNAKVKSTGLTPYEANFGRRMRLPIDIYTYDPNYNGVIGDDIKDFSQRINNQIKSMVRYAFENIDIATFEQKLYYDENRRDDEFNIGDIVTIRVYATSNKLEGFTKKLAPKREGPYVIIKKLNPLNYILGDVHTKEARTYAHIAQLKKYHMRDNQPSITATDIPGSKENDNPSTGTRATFGLGHQRGRKRGQKNKLKPPPSSPMGQADRVTRSQTAALQPSTSIANANSTVASA